MKTAVITGATGQDGALLSKLLLDKGYRVIGIQRRTASPTDWRIKELGLYDHPNYKVASGDLTDQSSLDSVMKQYRPDEIYNLGAQSFVGASWDMSISTLDITGLGAVRVFEAALKYCPEAKIYQASSSEMFGLVNRGVSLDEFSLIRPRSPYGVAKSTAHYAAINYRESYGLQTYCGILFNHESEYRGEEFVTRKITKGVAEIYLGISSFIELINLDSMRDWGHAEDYVLAMWKMLNTDAPYHSFVIATGKVHSIADLLIAAFGAIGVTNWRPFVRLTQRERPAEVPYLLGNAGMAREHLGWTPSIQFEDMVCRMVEKDIERLRNGK